MEYQKPAVGITKIFDHTDLVTYAVPCTCGSADCGLDFSVEIEADEWYITVSTDFHPKTDFWTGLVASHSKLQSPWLWSIDYELRRWLNGLYTRLSMTYRIWTAGYLTYYQDVLMTEQQALNYAGTITAAIEDMQRIRQQRNSEKGC
jgi:hypothetical protein